MYLSTSQASDQEPTVLQIQMCIESKIQTESVLCIFQQKEVQVRY